MVTVLALGVLNGMTLGLLQKNYTGHWIDKALIGLTYFNILQLLYTIISCL